MTTDEPTRAQMMKRLWSTNPDIYRILKESYDTEEARWRLYDYLLAKERDLYINDPVYHPLEWTQTRDCITTFKSIISRRSERMAKASTLDHLRRIAHGKPAEELTWGFVEEMRRLFLGVIGKSGIYDPKRTPKFLGRTGREAAVLRSKELDWKSFKWQFRHSIDDERVLKKLIQLSRGEIAAIRKTRRDKLPFGITPYYVSLMDQASAEHNSRDRGLRTHVIP
jgi:lysine 2,3-aminomutase